MHKEIKIHPRQSCLLKMALGKRSLSAVGEIKAGYPGKGLVCAPFFSTAMTFVQCLEGPAGLYMADFSTCPQGSKICH